SRQAARVAQADYAPCHAAGPPSQSRKSGSPSLIARGTGGRSLAGGTTSAARGARSDEFDSGFARLAKDGPGALFLPWDGTFLAPFVQIVRLAAHTRLPTLYGQRRYVDAGGLVSYGPSAPEAFRRAAVYVDKILNGANPADLPVEQPTKFELVINLKTA